VRFVEEEQPARRPPPQEFNRYINASDLLKEFIAFLGTQGVRQHQVLKMPLDFFIKWIIIRACEEDQVEPNVELPALPPPAPRKQCLGCGQFMKAESLIPLHGEMCASRHFARQPA